MRSPREICNLFLSLHYVFVHYKRCYVQKIVAKIFSGSIPEKGNNADLLYYIPCSTQISVTVLSPMLRETCNIHELQLYSINLTI